MNSSKSEPKNTKEEVNKDDTDEMSHLEPNPAEEDEKKKLTYRERLKLIKDNTTVEPIVACYITGSILALLAIQNLNLEKACRVNLNYSTDVCDALNLRQTENYTFEEQEVQKLIASIAVWKNVVQTSIPVLLILFVGAWSDKTGKRKACIMLPIVGEFLACLGFIVNTYFFELPVEVSAFTEAIFPAITGGWFTNFVGTFSYISDITTEENRTYRVGLVNIFITSGYSIGSALTGVMLPWVGYYGVFTVSLSLYLFCLIYGYQYLEDPKQTSEKKLVST